MRISSINVQRNFGMAKFSDELKPNIANAAKEFNRWDRYYSDREYIKPFARSLEIITDLEPDGIIRPEKGSNGLYIERTLEKSTDANGYVTKKIKEEPFQYGYSFIRGKEQAYSGSMASDLARLAAEMAHKKHRINIDELTDDKVLHHPIAGDMQFVRNKAIVNDLLNGKGKEQFAVIRDRLQKGIQPMIDSEDQGNLAQVTRMLENIYDTANMPFEMGRNGKMLYTLTPKVEFPSGKIGTTKEQHPKLPTFEPKELDGDDFMLGLERLENLMLSRFNTLDGKYTAPTVLQNKVQHIRDLRKINDILTSK